MSLPRILLVDNNPTRIQQLEIILQFMEFQVATATFSQLVDNSVNFSNTALVFISEEFIEQPGITDVITTLPIIVLQDHSISLVSVPEKHKSYQYITWPATLPELSKIIKPLLASDSHTESKNPKADIIRTLPTERLQGKSTAIATVRKLIEQVASSDATVLILGESGTGKEVVARALHDLSSRRQKLFVPINCGAIPAELLESELFGHEKGAFTGALTSRQGRFEMAEGGTLFLDEIGDMPMTMQVKLLRVLQERTYERVGSNKTQHCDVRIVAATHRALEQEIQENRFREDLYYRLNVFPIEMPALRARKEDIPPLVSDLSERLKANQRGYIQLTDAALAVLMRHDWPGNIRELANLIERLAIMYPKGLVDVADLPEKFKRYASTDELLLLEELDDNNTDAELSDISEQLYSIPPAGNSHLVQLPAQGIDLKEYLNVMEIDLIRQALEECNGVVAHAAKRLHMRRTTLVEKLRKYELQR